MAKFEIITIGGAVRDITFFTNQGKIFATPEDLTAQKMLAFEYGAKIKINEAHSTLGGGAANTAVSFSRLGFKTASIVRVGKDEDGKHIVNKLKKERVNCQLVQIDNKTRTGFSFILAVDKKDREHIAFVYRGANENLIFDPKKVNSLQANWLYLTSFSGSHWLKEMKNFFEFAKKQNIKVAWNPGILQLQAGKKILSTFLENTTALILNKDEAIELVLSGMKVGRRNPHYLNRPIYLLNILKDWGPKIVVVTEDKNGAWAYDGKKMYHQKAKKVKVVNTTGVGDAFGSSFIAGLIKNKGDVITSLKWGMANSAAILGKMGSQTGLLTLKELEKDL